MLFIWYLLNIDNAMTVWRSRSTSVYIFYKYVRSISHERKNGDLSYRYL